MFINLYNYLFFFLLLTLRQICIDSVKFQIPFLTILHSNRMSRNNSSYLETLVGRWWWTYWTREIVNRREFLFWWGLSIDLIEIMTFCGLDFLNLLFNLCYFLTRTWKVIEIEPLRCFHRFLLFVNYKILKYTAQKFHKCILNCFILVPIKNHLIFLN